MHALLHKLSIVLLGLLSVSAMTISHKRGEALQEPVKAGGAVPEQTFAHVNASGTVDYVLVITQNELDRQGGFPLEINGVMKFRPKSEFIETTENGSIRKNFAGKGFTYSSTSDAFIPPKQNPDATFDSVKARWVDPQPVLDQMMISSSTDITI